MDYGMVTNRNIIANNSFCFLISTVDARTILDVNFITHADAVYIATDNGIEPDAASSPITTSPTMVAFGAIKQLPGICGDTPFTGKMTGIF